jgi:dihydroorotate dehydrogenase
MSPEDALEKIKSGADLIQLYTGFIYNGPALIKQINKLLLK